MLASLAMGLLFVEKPSWLFPLMRHPAEASSILTLLLSHTFVFGLGFWRVSRNVTANKDIVIMGLIAQLLVFAIISYHIAKGDIGRVLGTLMAAVGLVSAIAFAVFLNRTKNSASHTGTS